MALNRKDVILASIVAFVSWGFITPWIPTLRFLPYAFIAGVAASLVTLSWIILSTSRGTKYGGQRAPSQRRPLAFTSAQAWKKEIGAFMERSNYEKTPLYRSSFVISDSIDGLLDLVLRDFIDSWYGNISKSPYFTNEVDRAVRATLATLRDRLYAVDVVELSVSRIIPIITAHMRDFYEAERLVRENNLTRNVTEDEELDFAIAGKYRDGNLHRAASLAFSDNKLLQQQHLRKAMEKIVPHVLPPSMTTSTAVLVLIKEIVACAVLLPVVQMLEDPDVLNQLIEGYGRTILQDRKTVRKLRAALDEHTPTSRGPKTMTLPRLVPGDSHRKFERFMRAIQHCNNLSDARRLRSEVASQLKIDAAVSGQDPTHLRRLQTGKQALDQKVAYLGGSQPLIHGVHPNAPAQPNPRSKLQNASLRELLYNASGLSCFMEYMDRLRLMSLVQFWIVVDGFCNPLKEDTDDQRGASEGPKPWTESDRNDILHISKAYLRKPELKISYQDREVVQLFLTAGDKATQRQYQSAQRAILRIQTSVYEEMRDRHFRNFQKSDLFYKCLAAEEPTSSTDRTPKRLSVFLAGESDATVVVPRISRPSQAYRKGSDLQRAAASSTDLKDISGATKAPPESRRSLDETRLRQPLFDDDIGDDPLARSTHSLEFDPSTTEQADGDNTEIVDAMQAALGDIMDVDLDGDSLFSETSTRMSQQSEMLQHSFEEPETPADVMPRIKHKEKPSLASLGLVSFPARRGVFSEDALFGEEETFSEDEHDSEFSEKLDGEDIEEAAPGDLGLSEAIEALRVDIEKLIAQDAVLDSLTSKAELTNNAAELRILRKSKASLQKELQRNELQRQRYIVQESDNSLYGRASVSIKSVMVGTDRDGTEYALYIIEVQRQAGEKMPAATWAVARRYSEFHALHKRLRSRYPPVRTMDFPRRQLVLKLQKDFLQKRRSALERYLRELLLIPSICRSRELRAFLSQRAILQNGRKGQQTDTRDFVARIYNSVADGMEEFFGNVPVLDQLSLAGQNIISAATPQLNTMGRPPGTAIANDPTTATEAEVELSGFENRELEPFIKPICDLFLETFELNRGNNWLRGRTVVVVLHQVLGATIERKVRDYFKSLTKEDSILSYISWVKDTMWPGGKLKASSPPRTEAEKAGTRKEAGLVLAMLIPEMAGSVVGRANAVAAASRVFATVNNRWLNTHLIFTILDEVLRVLFPGANLR